MGKLAAFLSNRSFLLTIGTRGVILVLGLATGILTARLLGPEGRGQYFLAVTLAALACQFGNLGLHASNTYVVAREPGAVGMLIGNSLFVTLALALPVTVLLAAAIDATAALPSLPPALLWLCVPLVPALLFSMLGANLMAGSERFRDFNAIELTRNVGAFAAILLAGLLGCSAWGFLAATTVMNVLLAAGILALLLWRFRAITLAPRTLLAHLAFGLRAYVVGLLSLFMIRGSALVLGWLGNAEEVGRLSIAMQIGDVLTILPSTVALLIFPTMVRAQAGGWPAMLENLRGVAMVMAGACVAAAALAPLLVPLMFGEAFRSALPALYALLPGIYAYSLITIVSQYVSALDMPWSLAGMWIVACGLMVVAAASWTPTWQAQGAAAATSLGSLAMLVLVFLLARTYAERSSHA